MSLVATRRARRRGERGSGLPGFVVSFPLLLVLIAALIHVALYEYGQHVLDAAAQEGAASSRVQGGTDAAGQDRANRVLTTVGRGVVLEPTVTVTRSATSVRVQVSGRTVSLLPFLPASVHGDAEAPLEP